MSLFAASSPGTDKDNVSPKDTGTSGSPKSIPSSIENGHNLSRTQSSSSTVRFHIPSRPMTSSNQEQRSAHDEVTPIISRDSRDTRSYDAIGSSRNSEIGSAQPRDAQRTSKSAPDTDREDDTNAAQDESPGKTGPSWYKRLADKYGSLELDNKGSVARDHLALERTFLAWLRTSLAFASIGIAITQLFRLNGSITGDGTTTNDYSSVLTQLLPSSYYDASRSVRTTDQSTRLRNIGKPLGATFIAIAIVILFLGFHRYFESQYWIVRGKFPASRGSIAIVSFIALALIIASLVVILVVAPGAVES